MAVGENSVNGRDVRGDLEAGLDLETFYPDEPLIEHGMDKDSWVEDSGINIGASDSGIDLSGFPDWNGSGLERKVPWGKIALASIAGCAALAAYSPLREAVYNFFSKYF